MSLANSVTFDETAFVGGLSDPSTAQYRHRRTVLDLINKLHSYGLQHQLDLPQIAVVGSQSVGKSSLIESISGITLPRAKGTCTRCPIECRLSRSSSPWSCEVYLRFKGQHEVPFGSTITENSEVEERIRRAQLAIRNPKKRASDYLGALGQVDGGTPNEVSFSSDLISVRISGQEVDDLSFVDLPGIIASVRDDGREADIEEVKALVMNIIERPSCLILLIVSCETDIENQGAMRLAKQVDLSGNRTIPVLTKPDRIATSGHDSWLRLLSNEQERFKHGWRCVKQSDQQQLDDRISWDDARQNETNFFKTTAPWNSLDESIRSRLGTQFLTEELGNILFELICKRLPGLLVEVERKVQQVKGGIAEMPAAPSGDPVATIWKMVSGFQKDVQQLVDGRPESGTGGLIQIFRKSKEQFREAIFRQAPNFQPFEKSQDPQDLSSFRSILPGFNNEVNRKEALEPFGLRDSSTLVYLDEVLDMARNAITRELPHNYPYAVKKHYVARFTRDWPIPAKNLFDGMERQFLKELKGLVVQHFSPFAPGGLEEKVLRTVLGQLKECSKRTQTKMRECIALEHEEPTTVNEDYLADYKHRFCSNYKALRGSILRNATKLQRLVNGGYQNTPAMQTIFSNLKDMGLDKLSYDDLLRLLPVDLADDAIDIMAEVRAYYQVAFKRFVDYMPMIIDFELLKGFCRTLDDALLKGLGLGEDQLRQRCLAYLEEDPLLVCRRDSLHRDLERFETALADLQNIPGVISDPGSDNKEPEEPTCTDSRSPIIDPSGDEECIYGERIYTYKDGEAELMYIDTIDESRGDPGNFDGLTKYPSPPRFWIGES